MPLPGTHAAPTSPSELQTALSVAERCITAVSQALLCAQPDLLEAAARELQQAARGLSGAVQCLQGKTALDQLLKQRLSALARGMAMQREACVRRLAVVERSLYSVIPSTRPSTYAGAVRPYARGGKQVGAFRAFS